MCYNQTGDISTLEGTPLKLVDKFTYLGSSVESTEKDIETRLTKAWTAINRLSTIWKSDLTDKMKRSFFQAAVTSILLYGCTTWTLTKRLEKKLDGNYTRMLRAILNKSWQQHPTRHQLYGHLPPITKSIQVRRTRHAGHCWRSRDELIRDVLLWIPTHGRAKAGRPARTYIQQLCEDTGCCPEDLPRAMNDREEWRERVRDIRAASTIWWWWWWWQLLAVTWFLHILRLHVVSVKVDKRCNSLFMEKLLALVLTRWFARWHEIHGRNFVQICTDRIESKVRWIHALPKVRVQLNLLIYWCFTLSRFSTLSQTYTLRDIQSHTYTHTSTYIYTKTYTFKKITLTRTNTLRSAHTHTLTRAYALSPSHFLSLSLSNPHTHI